MEQNTLHTDCFAFNETDNEDIQCVCLTRRVCNNKECRFYKQLDDCDMITKKLIEEQKETFNKKGN